MLANVIGRYAYLHMVRYLGLLSPPLSSLPPLPPNVQCTPSQCTPSLPLPPSSNMDGGRGQADYKEGGKPPYK